MSQDIRGSLLWDDEPAFEDEDTSWDDDEEFDVTDEDCEVKSVGWEPDDLPSDRDKDRYRQYLTKKQYANTRSASLEGPKCVSVAVCTSDDRGLPDRGTSRG